MPKRIVLELSCLSAGPLRWGWEASVRLLDEGSWESSEQARTTDREAVDRTRRWLDQDEPDYDIHGLLVWRRELPETLSRTEIRLVDAVCAAADAEHPTSTPGRRGRVEVDDFDELSDWARAAARRARGRLGRPSTMRP